MTARDDCLKCNAPLSQPVRGRPKRYCSTACRRAAEFELRRLQNALIGAEREVESVRRTVEAREAGLARYGGTLTPAIERLEFEHATRRLGELEDRLRLLLTGDDEDDG